MFAYVGRNLNLKDLKDLKDVPFPLPLWGGSSGTFVVLLGSGIRV